MQIPKMTTAPRSSSIHMKREKAAIRMRVFKSFPANEHFLSLCLGCLVCHRNRRRRLLSMINMDVRVWNTMMKLSRMLIRTTVKQAADHEILWIVSRKQITKAEKRDSENERETMCSFSSQFSSCD